MKISEETLTIAEGASGTYTVVLATRPGGQVTVTPTSGATGKATVSGALTFTTGNWDTAQTVTVTGVDEGAATVSHTVSGYGGVSSVDAVNVTVTPAPSNDNVVRVPERVEVEEGAGSAVVRITTEAAFGASVTFNVTYGRTSTTSDTDATGASDPASGDYDNDAVTSVTFGPSETSKDIRIPITDDQLEEEDETFTVSIAPASALPNGFTLGNATTTVTLTDDDQTVVPAAPTGLRATTGNAQITLTWDNPDNPTITRWQVQQKQGDGSYGAWIDLPDSNATSYTVTGLTNGTLYSFRIRAVNAAGPGVQSEEVTATPLQPPLKPTGLTATAGDAQVTLTWTGPTDATISKWQVQQKQGDGSYGAWRDVPDSNASTTSYTVTDLTNGMAYGFRIRAVNAAGNGVPSDEVRATPFSQKDVDQAGKARTQASAATSRAWLGMATDVLGSRIAGDGPVDLAAADDSLGEQALGIVENLLGIGGSELPTDLTLAGIEERLWSQSFQFTPPEGGASQQGSWALWGAGELRSYRSEEEAEDLSSSGNMKTAWLGVDHRFGDPWLAGVAVSFSSGESDYSYRKTDGATDGGKMTTQFTTVYPYGSFQVSEQFRLWGTAGMGWGSQQHRQTGSDTQAEGDLRLRMGVIGFERELSSIGDLNLSLAGDVGLARSTTQWEDGSGLADLSVTLSRVRLGVDSSFPLTEHTTGYLNLKGRLDGGDLPMNAAEIVAGVQYSRERFSGFLQGRQVYAFDGSYAESGLTAQLRFSSRADGTGLAWTFQPSYGASGGDVALAAGPSLWTDEQLESLSGSSPSQESREITLSSRLGYGIRFQSGDLLLTPFTEVSLSEGSSHRIGLGFSVETLSWDVELSGSMENSGNASPTGKVELNFSKQL